MNNLQLISWSFLQTSKERRANKAREYSKKPFSFAMQCCPTWMPGNFVQKLQMARDSLRNMVDLYIGLQMKNANREKGFCHNCLFFHLITYILSPRIFVAPPRYTLLCPKSRFTIVPEATAVKRWLRFTISVPCSPSRMISTWCHCSSCKVKSVDILVTPCPRLNLFQKSTKGKFYQSNYIHF